MEGKVVELGEICEARSSNIAQKDIKHLSGEYPIYGASGFIKHIDFYNQDRPYIAIVKDGAGVGRAMLLPAHSSVIGTMQYILPRNDVDINYLYHVIANLNLKKYKTGATIPHIYFRNYKAEKIVLPEMKEQKNITNVFNKIIELTRGYKKQLHKLDLIVKSRFVEMFGNPEFNDKQWNVSLLSDVCTIGSSKRIYQSEQSTEGIPFLRISDLINRMDTGLLKSDLFISKKKFTELKEQGLVPKSGDILVTSRGTLGRCYIIGEDDDFYFQDGMISWLSQFEDNVTSDYISYLFSMQGFRKQIASLQAGSTIAYLSIAMLKKLKVMIPDKYLQVQFIMFVKQVDKSKLRIKKALENIELLNKALMQQYFN